jgi:hypothetical protein
MDAPKQKSAKQWFGLLDRRQQMFTRQWYKDAREAIQIYETKHEDATQYNILFSNTETLLPALYNSTPRPDIARRFGMDAGSPAAAVNHAAAEIGNRFLTYTADTNSEEYEDYSTVTQTATFSALLTGFGLGRVHSTGQEVCYEQVPFDRFLWGFARTWKQVPWVAYGHDMSKAGFEAQFPDVLGQPWYKAYTWPEPEPSNEQKTPGDESVLQGAPDGTMLVWEIWDWENKQILFVCKASEQFLAQDPYPFQLTSRFPSPEPVRLVKRLLNLEPLVPYVSYRKQAQMLQTLTRRLNKVLEALKVRGVYNSNLGELSQILNDDTDNKLVASENAAAFIDGKGLDAQIWLMPIDMLIQVAGQLIQAQGQIKNTIFEIMGIADVMRGASQASETLGAQEIKNQWGTLRMKRAQRDIQVFCRDMFRIALEFGVNTLSPQQLKMMTGVQYPLEIEQQQALQGQQAYQMAVAQAQQMGGQPPPQPTIAQIAMTTLPTMEAACGILKDNFQRQYRIDIETNSTIDLEASEDQKNIGDFMNAFGQMMAGLQPLVADGSMSFDVAKVIMIEVTRRFKFGRDVEDALETMQAPAGGSGMQQAKALQNKIDTLTQQFQLQLAQRDADNSTKLSKVEEQLVLKVGELEVAKVQLAQASLEQAKTEIKAATQGLANTKESLAAMSTQVQAKGQQVQANAKVAAANDKLHREQVAHAATKVGAALTAHEQRVSAQQREHELRVKQLQKPPAGPTVA